VKLILILIAILLLLCSQAWATPYFVRDDGNDGNDGTTDAQAWLTLSYASAQMGSKSAGDDLYLKCDDVWASQKITIDWDGVDSNNPSVIGAYYGNGTIGVSGNKPIIGGSSHTYPGQYEALIYGEGIDYVTIKNIRLANSYSNGIYLTGHATRGHSTNLIVEDCWTYHNGKNGIFMGTTGSHEYGVQDSIIRDNLCERDDYDGILAGSVSSITINGAFKDNTTKNILIQGNTVIQGTEGIGIYKTACDIIVEYNIVRDGQIYHIYVAGGSHHITIRHNLVYESTSDRDSSADSLIVMNNECYQNIPPRSTGDLEIYGNLIASGSHGIQLENNCASEGLIPSNINIYNNTIVDCDANFYIYGTWNGINSNIKNNISYTIDGGSTHINNASPTGITFSHNNYDEDPGGNANDNAVIGVPGISKTSNWQSLVAGAVDGTEFKLLDTNNCEDAGLDLGGTPTNPYYYILDLDDSDFTAFTFEILNQNDYGAGWEIGGDVYQSSGEDPPSNNDCSSAIAHYKLDADVEDSTTNNNDLTAVGTPTYSGNGIVLNGSSQYAHITNLSGDIGSVSLFANFKFDNAFADGETDPICGEYDFGDNERVFILLIGDATGAGDGNDVVRFRIGHTNGTGNVALESTYAMSPGTQYSVLATYDTGNDDAHIYIHNLSGTILNGASGETDATLLDASVQNVESTPFVLGSFYDSGSPFDYFDGTIFEVAIYDSEKSQQDGQDFALTEYSDASAISVQGMSSACGNITAAGVMTWAIGWDKEPYTEGGAWTIDVDFDYPTTTQTMNYVGKWNDQVGWTNHVGNIWKKTTYIEPTSVKADTNVLAENDGNFATLGANEWDWASSILYVNVGSDPDDDVITPTPWETYIAIDTLAGWRQNSFGDAQIGADITLPSGVTITDIQDTAATIVGALTGLGTYPSNTVANPKLSTDPWDLSAGGDYATFVAFDTAIYSVPDDNFDCNFTGDINTDIAGTSGHEIVFTGTVTGQVTIDEDYIKFERMIIQ